MRVSLPVLLPTAPWGMNENRLRAPKKEKIEFSKEGASKTGILTHWRDTLGIDFFGHAMIPEWNERREGGELGSNGIGAAHVDVVQGRADQVTYTY